jgi:inorganic pyrophosphatase
MATSMHYPCNYGYIPQTLADDGDPVDVLVITPVPLIPGVVVTCRPLGVLKMDDEAGGDNKLLAVPIDKILSIYSQWQKPEDLNPMRLKTIQHFFEHYKDLEEGKWVKVLGWEGPDSARQEVAVGMANWKRSARPEREIQPSPQGAAVAFVVLERAVLLQFVDVVADAGAFAAPGVGDRLGESAGRRSQCAEWVRTGSRPRAILCSPWAPPSKRR